MVGQRTYVVVVATRRHGGSISVTLSPVEAWRF